ncbi:MAG TPA: anaerobic ribonucleoside-triphosphate reductase, partial [Pyrodictium sp.]|nr:anaerobic ribonucleoside-triphosphate reductase [Pyrodictium sp.]
MVLDYLPEVFKLTGTPYFLTVGVIGLPEAAAIMMGDPKAWREGSRSQWREMAEWMRQTVEYIVGHTRRWSMRTGLAFNVEEVPGESAAAKLARRDSRLYPRVLNYLPDPEEPV